MAIPKDLIAKADAKLATAAKDGKPDGYIRAGGRWLGVWLPAGKTAADLGLKTFVPDKLALRRVA